ncbi:MAG: hypothetical protein QM811_17235 [Pirellulales bacterium]
MSSATTHRSTLYDQTAPRWSAWRCVYWIALTIVLIALTRSPWKSGYADAPERVGTDLQLYASEVEQLRAGDHYYDVAVRELVARGFPTRSVFNWRTPATFVTTAAVGNSAARIGLALVAFATWWFVVPTWKRRSGTAGVLLGTVMLLGAALPCALEQAWLMPEVWSGLCIGLSAAAFAAGYGRIAILAGVAALFCRELAAPYVLICAIFAWRGESYRELLGWFAGCVAYALFYAWHAGMVLPRIAPDALAHDRSWLAFGGVMFVISLVQMNVWLLIAPQWLSAIALSATALSWSVPSRIEAEQRWAWCGLAYVLIFACVGLPFNQYWGSQIAPLLALSAGCVPAALRMVFFGVTRKPNTTTEDMVAAA